MISQNYQVWGGGVSKGSVTMNESDLFVFLGFAAAANFFLFHLCLGCFAFPVLELIHLPPFKSPSTFSSHCRNDIFAYSFVLLCLLYP